MDYFLGEIRLFPVSWAPVNWLQCNGQIVSIRQYQALFSLLGNRFGGDGSTNFALPDLRGRAIIGWGRQASGSSYDYAQQGGSEEVALTIAQVAPHNHTIRGASPANSPSDVVQGIANNYLGSSGPSSAAPAQNLFAVPRSPVGLNAGVISNSGAGEEHNNMQPFLVLNFCISSSGIYPSHQ